MDELTAKEESSVVSVPEVSKKKRKVAVSKTAKNVNFVQDPTSKIATAVVLTMLRQNMSRGLLDGTWFECLTVCDRVILPGVFVL